MTTVTIPDGSGWLSAARARGLEIHAVSVMPVGKVVPNGPHAVAVHPRTFLGLVIELESGLSYAQRCVSYELIRSRARRGKKLPSPEEIVAFAHRSSS